MSETQSGVGQLEVEIRSFVSETKYKKLLEFFKANGKLIREDEQETHYFDGPADVRIQKNRGFSKIWMKGGKMHEDAREEVEIRVDREDFSKLQEIFRALGHKVKIKWFRTRNMFLWEGITVCLDFTKGYGHILELEKLCSADEKEACLKLLNQKMKELSIKPTPKDIFHKKFKHYEENWQTLTEEV